MNTQYQAAWEDGFRASLNFCIMFLKLDDRTLKLMHELLRKQNDTK